MKMKIYAIAAFISLLIAVQPVFSQSNQIYFLNLEYDNGEIKLIDVSLGPGNLPGKNFDLTEYKYEMISAEGRNVFSSKFTIPREVIVEGEDSVILDNVNVTVIVPYIAGAERILIKGENNETLLSVDVSKFSNPEEESLILGNSNMIIFLAIGIIAITGVIVFIVFRKKQNDYENLKKKWSRN